MPDKQRRKQKKHEKIPQRKKHGKACDQNDHRWKLYAPQRDLSFKMKYYQTQTGKYETVFMNTAAPEEKGGDEKNRDSQHQIVDPEYFFQRPVKRNGAKKGEEIENNDIREIVF
jgi:hypothetical protein